MEKFEWRFVSVVGEVLKEQYVCIYVCEKSTSLTDEKVVFLNFTTRKIYRNWIKSSTRTGMLDGA